MQWLRHNVTERPWLVLALLLLATVPFVLGARRARIANPLEGWFVRGDPVLADYRAFLDRFGNDEVVLVALNSPHGIFEKAVLAHVDRVTRALESVQHVRTVLSLSTVPVLTPVVGGIGGLGVLELGVLHPLDRTPPHIIRDRLRAQRVSWEQLVSDDETTTLIYVVPEVLEDDSVRTSILAEIRATLARELEGSGLEYRLAGSGVIFDAINEASAQSVSRVLLPAAIAATVLLFLALRSVVRVLTSLVAAGIATTWAVGLFGITGVPINLITTTVPTIVAVISMANSIHLLRRAIEPDDVSSGSFRLPPVVTACLFSALTSAAAFLALSVSDIQVLRELGRFTAAGIMASFVVSALICLPVASILRRRAPASGRDAVGEWLSRLGERIIRRRPAVFAVVGVLIVAALIGTFRLRIDTYSLGFLPGNHPVRLDSDWIEQHYGFYTPIMFELSGDEGSFSGVEMVGKIQVFQDALESHPDIEGVNGLPDLFVAGHVSPLRPRNPVTAPGDARQATPDGHLMGAEDARPLIPDDPAVIRETVDVLRLVLGPAAIDRLVDTSFSDAHVSGRIRMQSAAGLAATVEEALESGLEVFGPDVAIKAVGYIPLYVKLTRYLGTSFLKSLPLVIGLNFLLLLVLLRSLWWAALATPSNILPVFLLLGAMGWVGVPLDVASVSIACIAFGILVDDTIHLLTQSRLAIEAGLSRREAVLRALRRGGSAITWTTVVLVGGFATFLVAQVVPVRYFGSLLGSTLLVGLTCDIVLITAIVSMGSRD